MGFPRSNGVGIRNYVGVMCTVGCSNDVVREIVQLNPRTKAITHNQGCAQTLPDLAHVEKVLINLGLNPNIHSILLVSLGCESVSLDKIADGIAKEKTVETITVQDSGMSDAVSKGSALLSRMVAESEKARMGKFDFSELKLALKCGGSDTSSGEVSNPIAGKVADKIVEANGTVIFGETTELIGAEHVLVRRAASDDIAKRLYAAVERMEKRAMSMGADMRGGQPTGGNIRGGITTIEEKSLGAISKTGTSKLVSVVDYGDRVENRGLVFMDTPGRDIEALTGFAAGGAQMLLFSTGRGAPQGFPIVPVVKISGNPETCNRLHEHIDVDVGAVFSGAEAMDSAAERVWNEIVQIASGKLTKAELLGYDQTMDIYVRGPVI